MTLLNQADTWALELRYIESINPLFPGKTFNHDSLCFARYCEMQARSASRDGKPLVAEAIERVRDVARNGG